MPDSHSNVFIFLLAESGYEVNKITSFFLLWIVECKLTKKVVEKLQYSWVFYIVVNVSVARSDS